MIGDDLTPDGQPTPGLPIGEALDEATILGIQEQWWSEARDVAWRQTYGGRNRRRLPLRSEAHPSARNQRWKHFRIVEARGNEKLVGVYGIVHRGTDRFYVGSSVDIRARLRKHLSDLASGHHHSKKLQNIWDVCEIQEFCFVLIERVDDVFDLRAREQHWIDETQSFASGFNSKSRADGPELSLASHLERALNLYGAPIYEGARPKIRSEQVTSADREAFKSELRKILPKRALQLASLIAIVWIAFSERELRFVSLGLFYLVPALLFFWPESAKNRAISRGYIEFQEADDRAMRLADAKVVKIVSERLGIPQQQVEETYKHLPEILERRERQREKYRRLNYRSR